MKIFPIVHLDVNLSDRVYTITDPNTSKKTPFNEYTFENGVQYVLNSSEDIWLTWKNSENSSDILSDSTTTQTLEVVNLTTHEHHQHVTDNLIYFTHQCKIDFLQFNHIGQLDRQIDSTVPFDPDQPLSDIQNDQLAEFNRFFSNDTLEEALNIDQEDFVQQAIIKQPFNPVNNTSTIVWND